VEVQTITLQEVAEFGELTEEGNLRFKGKEISVAYFRTGYNIKDYTEDAFAGRLLIEKSSAIKCPNIDL